jgi:hypothetical protein
VRGTGDLSARTAISVLIRGMGRPSALVVALRCVARRRSSGLAFRPMFYPANDLATDSVVYAALMSVFPRILPKIGQSGPNFMHVWERLNNKGPQRFNL